MNVQETLIYLQAASLSAVQLGALITSGSSLFHLMMLVNVDDIRFTHFDGEALADPSDWQDGNVFGKTVELRWRRRNGQYRVCICTESADARNMFAWPLAPENLVLKAEESEQIVRLWGEHYADNAQGEESYWWESAISRPIQYPIEGIPAFVALQTRLYVPLDGSPGLTRFLDLVPWSPAS